MTYRTLRHTVLACACLLLATPAGAQRGIARLQPGQAVAGTVTDRDPAFSDGRRFQVFRLLAQQDTTYVLTVRSTAFAPHIEILREAGPITEVVKKASLSIWDPNAAWIRFSAPESGSYLVAVSSQGRFAGVDTTMTLAEDEFFPDTETAYTDTIAYTDTVASTYTDTTAVYTDTMTVVTDTTMFALEARPVVGAYELSMQTLPLQPQALASRRLAVGDSIRGRLDSRSARDTNARPQDLFTLTARAGQRLRITLESEAFYPSAHIGRLTEGQFVTLEESGPATDSLAPAGSPRSSARISGPGSSLQLTFPRDGEFVVAVVGPDPVMAGDYRISLTEAPPRTVRPVLPVTAGEVVNDALRGENAEDDGSLYADWIYMGREGERITVTMERNGPLDPMLAVGYMEGSEFRSLSSNDDAEGQGLNSRVTLTLPQTRAYVVRAMAYGSSEGEYFLRVASTAGGPRILHTERITAGGEVQGTLDATDEAHELDGSPYEHWLYRTTQEVERVTVTLSSGDFDTVLSLGQIRNGRFEEFARNDDAPVEGDLPRVNTSRLVAVLPGPAEYVIRVNTFGPEESGSYVLRVDREPDSP